MRYERLNVGQQPKSPGHVDQVISMQAGPVTRRRSWLTSQTVAENATACRCVTSGCLKIMGSLLSSIADKKTNSPRHRVNQGSSASPYTITISQQKLHFELRN